VQHNAVMGLQFERPVGSPLDVAELEYCSALRQTNLAGPLRVDGSLTADDVRLHILSRHGVPASIDQVEQLLLYELAGGILYEEEANDADEVDDEELDDDKKEMPSSFKKEEEEEGKAAADDSLGASEKGGGLAGGGGAGGTSLGGSAAVLVPFAVGDGDDNEAEAGEVEIVPEGQEKEAANDGGRPFGRRRMVRRVTPLDVVQQVSLLLIPELKKLRVAAQVEEEFVSR
jgi:hypothetical protein